MIEGQIYGGMSLRYEYSYTGEAGHSVGLNVRSYDPSGPFQNEPDINRFTASLRVNGLESAIHDRQYEG